MAAILEGIDSGSEISDLVFLAQSGDQKAVECLYNKYESILPSLTRGLFLPHGTHEDLEQEARIALIRAIKSYSNASIPFEAFARLVVKRKLIEVLKYTQREKRKSFTDCYYLNDERLLGFGNGNGDDLFPDKSIFSDPAEAVVNTMYIHTVINTIQEKLSSNEKMVFNYFFLQNLPYKQIAEILEKTPKAIDNTIKRIRYKANLLKDELCIA